MWKLVLFWGINIDLTVFEFKKHIIVKHGVEHGVDGHKNFSFSGWKLNKI